MQKDVMNDKQIQNFENKIIIFYDSDPACQTRIIMYETLLTLSY